MYIIKYFLNSRKLFRFIFIFLAGCSTVQEQPKIIDNICSIFKEYPNWFWYTQEVEKKWKIPISVQMAIVNQESKFIATAKPDYKKLIWIIPEWKKNIRSTAYGYPQAIKKTWKSYKISTNSNKAHRTNFFNSVDFVGWYSNEVKKKLGIKFNDVKNIYLAYHEGIGGYKKKTYLNKIWLMQTAYKVHHLAWLYQKQLKECRQSLNNKFWYLSLINYLI